tara:strand:+ start:283 stop:444 length:162 start_codon:yes stop_codon:yes gene_type:complete
MKFGFYRKNDPNKEMLMIQDTESLQQAVDFFAAVKALPVEQFLEIYAVTSVKK